MNIKIIGAGHYLPEKLVTNEDLEKTVPGVNAVWTKENLGIEQRYIVVNDTVASLATHAALRAITSANINKNEIDLIILATATPDKIAPATAPLIQKALGIEHATSFDIAAVCSGWVYGFILASSLIETGQYKTALVIGADIFSKITDWTSRSCVFFGDGAGAVLIQKSKDNHVLGFATDTYATGHQYFKCEHYETFTMDTQGIFETARTKLPLVIDRALSMANITKQEISSVLPHQASVKTLRALATVCELPWEAFKTNMDKVANTSGGTIPILLSQEMEKSSFHEHDKILFVSIGSGMTLGALIYEW
jgi:3-oxoacyl-[acyl-carrier-protein] synthase-3